MLCDSCCVTHAVARKDKASVGEMQAVVGMQLLEVLLIFTRSQSNRQRLLALGLLRALATAMKVSPLRIWRSVAKFRGSHCLGRRREGGGW